MPKVLTIEQILNNKDDGDAVQAWKGKIKKVWDRKAGSNNNGEWSFQGITLTDSTGEMDAKLKDREEMPKKMAGASIVILAHEGEKGWTGVRVKDEEFEKNGKTVQKRILWIAGSAEITKGGELPSGDDAPAKEPEEKPAMEKSAPQGKSSPANGNAVTEAKKFALKVANLQAIALRATDTMLSIYHEYTQGDDNKLGVVVTPELHQALALNNVIECMKKGLADDLPIEAIYPAKK